MGISVLTGGLTLAGSVLGQPVRLGLPDVGEEYGVGLRWVCGGFGGVIAENSPLREFEWTPPLALAAESPRDSWVSVEFRLEVRRRDALVGTRSFPAAFYIPEEIRPALTLTVEDTLGYDRRYGGFVQGKSRAGVRAQVRNGPGAGTDRVWLSCGCLSGLGDTLEFDLPEPGECNVRAEVRDSRGRKAEASRSITVLPYFSPAGEILKVERCGESGVPEEKGAYLGVSFRGRCAALGGRNTMRCSLLLCPEGSGEWEEYPVETGETEAPVLSLIPAPAKDYALCLALSDDFETVEVPYVPEGPALLDICEDIRAIGIGCRGDRTGTVSVGMGVRMQGNTLTGLPEPKEPEDALTLGFAGGRYWHPRLLWENPAPGEAFPARTVAVEGAGFLLVEAAAEAGQEARVFELCAVGVPGQIRCFSGEKPVYREFTWTDGGIAFQSASGGDNRAVPIRVYALTGS